MSDRKQNAPKADDLLNALDKFFPEWRYATFREIGLELLDDGLGPQSHSWSRIDYWAISSFGSPLTIYSIEVKVDRSDFKGELRNPQKQRWALMCSNLFYYCAPKGLIKPNELPPYAGLLEYEQGRVTVAIKAPWREPMPPRWTFVASLLSHPSRLTRRAPTAPNSSKNDARLSVGLSSVTEGQRSCAR
jgi:hypothetical protein